MNIFLSALVLSKRFQARSKRQRRILLRGFAKSFSTIAVLCVLLSGNAEAQVVYHNTPPPIQKQIAPATNNNSNKTNGQKVAQQSGANNQNANANAQKSPKDDMAAMTDDEFLKQLDNTDITAETLNFIYRKPALSFVILMILCGVFYLLWKMLRRDGVAPDKIAKGRTASDDEIREWEYHEKSGMFYLGQNYPIDKFSTWRGDVGIPFNKRSQHGFVEAPTGSGKTTCFVLKQLIEDGQSRMVNTVTFDRKGKEQFNKTAKIYKDLGHKVLYLSPWNKERSMGFEPLFGADEMELRALVEGHIIISADPNDSKTHYRILEQEILEGVFKTLKRLAMCQGPSASPEGARCKYKTDQEAETAEAKLAQEMRSKGEKVRPHPNCCMCRRRLATLPYAANIISLGYNPLRSLVMHYPDIWAECPTLRPANASPRTVEMLNGLKGKMRYYLDEGPKDVFSRSDFTLDEITYPDLLGNALSTILYIDAPQQQGRSAAVLSSVMSQLIYQKINERREIMEENGWSGAMVKLLCLWFDEIGTFTIPDVNNMLATMRDTNTGAVLLLQDQKQLQLFYEKVVPDTIHSNSYYKVYTGTINDERAKKVSESIGMKLASEKSYAYGSEGLIVPSEFERKKNLKQAEVPILAPNEIQFMCKPDFLREDQKKVKNIQEKLNLDGLAIVSSDRPPFVIKKWAYFREPKHSNLNWLINDSSEWNKYQLALIRKADLKNEKRPVGECQKFNDIPIKWEIVPKVYETVTKELSLDDNYIAITDGQVRVRTAKTRDLRGEPDPDYLEAFCKEHMNNKSLSELKKKEANKLIELLESELVKKGKGRRNNSNN